MTAKITKHDIAFFIIVVILILSSTVQTICIQARDVRDNTLRLHMQANSDSDFDQQLKIELRDELLKNFSGELSGTQNIDQAIIKTQQNVSEIENFLEAKIIEKGYEYKVKAYIVRMYFDTRVYSDAITMPAGNYSALRIIIGEGKGKNWWCVMYPPLCIPVATKGEALTIEEKILSLNKDTKFIPKFAVIEMFESLSK